MLPSWCTMLVPSTRKHAITYANGLKGPVGACQDQPITISWRARSEEHPHLTWFHWVWKSNATVFRPVVVAALGGHHHLPIEAELDDDPEPGQLVIA
jgi:hypothetical protein